MNGRISIRRDGELTTITVMLDELAWLAYSPWHSVVVDVAGIVARPLRARRRMRLVVAALADVATRGDDEPTRLIAHERGGQS